MTVRYYSSTAQPTTLSLNVTPSSTTIEVAALVGYPSSFPYTLCLDYDTGLRELVQVNNAAGTTLTVTRAVDGTSAIAHSAGATVRHVSSARDYADSRSHENSDFGVHGVVGDVVGTTDTQTLTNKTLTSPTISNPTVTGTISGATLASPTITGTVAGGASYTAPTITGPTITGTVLGSASYANATLNNPTITGVVSGNGNYREISVINQFVGNPPLIVNAITGTTAKIAQFRLNGSDRVTVGADGQIIAGSSGVTHQLSDNLSLSGTINSGAITSTGAISGTTITGTAFSGGTVSGTTGTFSGAVSGTTGTFSGAISASNITTGAWNTYTPSWTGSGTNPVLGNGTIFGRWCRVGRMITCQIKINWGSTTTNGGTIWFFSTPVAAQTATTDALGDAVAVDAGVKVYLGTASIEAGNSGNIIVYTDNTGSAWPQTLPFTPGNGDRVTIQITYEATS